MCIPVLNVMPVKGYMPEDKIKTESAHDVHFSVTYKR